MGLGKHLLNGTLSLVISVVATKLTASPDEEYDHNDMLLAVGVSAFLSGLFTSYFAED